VFLLEEDNHMNESTLNLTLPITGMTCASCVSHVEVALKELSGVKQVIVNLATNKANLVYDPKQVGLADMQRAVESVGYSVPTTELTLDVGGMTYASCVAHVEAALNELPGVNEAVVNLGLGNARVTYIPGVVTTSAMKRAVSEVG
jgi:Cu+-exporting ATPase